MKPRGSYAKGVARRDEILTRALEVIAREGYRGASVKEIADAVGLSQAGLLHYFDSKEHMFTEVLRKRDELDAMAFDARSEVAAAPLDLEALTAVFLDIVRRNAQTPGLVELFSRLAVDAVDPDHPAHAFFLSRGAALRSALVRGVRAGQDAAVIDPAVDAELFSRMFVALVDGIQLQWMLDPTVDMTAAVQAMFDLVRAASAK
jgi:Bacterial regulatory proteins, tetR family.